MVRFLQKSAPAATLTTLLLGMLFLGETKESVTYAFGALIPVLVLGVTWYCGLIEDPIPLKTGLFWAGFIIYVLSTGFWSADTGSSILETSRYVGAFIIYYVFSSATRVHTAKNTINMLYFFCVAASALMIFFIFLPQSVQNFPMLNLLLLNYGHTLGVILPLFLLPAAFLWWMQNGKMSSPLLMLTIVALTLSRGRAAALLAVLFIGTAVFIGKRKMSAARMIVPVLMTICIAGAGLFLWGRPYTPIRLPDAELVKSGVESDKRIQYWGQAARSIQERPFLGTGIGTFYITSREFQTKAASNSWYAHNFLLELAADTGLIGVALFLAVFVETFIKPAVFLVKRNRAASVLSASILLAFLYGLVDISFILFPVWYLFWASVGVIDGLARKEGV